MLAKLTQVVENLSTSEYALKTIFVNPDHVITIIEDDRLQTINRRQPLLEGLDTDHEFSRIAISSGGTQSRLITVIGSPETVMEALKNDKRQLIRG
jgi:hypothetical protein